MTSNINTQHIITVVRDPKNHLGKQFSLNSDGTIRKQAAVSISFGIAMQHQIDTHDDLAQLLEKVGDDPNAAIINSSFNGIEIGEEFIIRSSNQIEKNLGIPSSDRTKQSGIHSIEHDGKTLKAVGRFKENMRPSCWQFFDRDVDLHTPEKFKSQSFEEWKSSLETMLPALTGVSYCIVGSSSARVLHDGKPVGGGNGHVWVKFADPADVERFRTAVMVAAAQARMTWTKPRYSRKEPNIVVGQSLTTIIDASVLTPGRLVFIGKPVVNDGLTVKPLSATVHVGTHDTFDSTTVSLPDTAIVRKITREAGVEMDVNTDGNGLSISAKDLTLDIEIDTADHGVKTLRELIEAGNTTKIRCQTPFRDSSSYAAFVNVGKDGTPFVFDSGTSTMHWLIDAEKGVLPLIVASGVVKRLMPKVKLDCGAPFEPEAVDALRIIKKNAPADFQRIRVELKNANAQISLVNLDRLLKAPVANDSSLETHHGFSKDILKRLTVGKYCPIGHAGELFVFNEEHGIWEVFSIEKLAQLVAEAHDGLDNCKRGSDYKAISQHIISIATDESFFASAPVGLACPNGFYRIVGNEIKLEKLTADHRQRVKLDFSPKQMSTPLFDNFLHETFQSCNEGEEAQQIALLQEIAGATTLGIAHKFQKAALLTDPFGRAGKGTYERIQRELVPASFISAVSPFNWGSEYYLATMAGMRLNVVGELPDDKPIPAAAFKTVIGGDLLTGRHPTHRPISFKNEAAHLFMSNHMINTTDHSEAFYSRWVIVEFPNSRLVSGLPINPNLPDHIIEAEMPGIAQWALMGAARLVANGAYSKSSAHERVMAKWRRRTNSLEEFMFESCEMNSDYSIRRSCFYKAYTAWCNDSGRKPFAKAKVKDLLAHNIGHGIAHTTINGIEMFKGIQLNLIFSEELAGQGFEHEPERCKKNDPANIQSKEHKEVPHIEF